MRPIRPEISVVIPTHRRETRLAFLLDALARQSLPRERFEVIVVRAGPRNGPEAEAPDGLEVRMERIEQPCGPVAKRNLAIGLARGELVAFTDDDCRPAADWLERLLGAWEGEGRGDVVIQGRTIPDPDEDHLLFGRARSIEVDEPSWFEACNIAYPRQLLERIGGFDPEFVWGGEDTDLGIRAEKAGARLVFMPEALVMHAVHPGTVKGVVADGLRFESLPLLLCRHPEFRSRAHRGLFWKRTHERFLLALAGLLLVRRSKLLALVLALPWLSAKWDRTARLRPRRVAGYLAGLPLEAAGDGAEVYAMARASVRHRTLLL